jgi:hypothetical protein
VRCRQSRQGGPARTSPVLSLLLATTVVLAAVLALWDAGAAQAAARSHSGSNDAQQGDPSAWVQHDVPDPVAVRSDDVDIESPTVPLGKHDDGRLEVPRDAHTAGWWTGRSNPGERGPAVIVGHVDSREGPGAFWELVDLEVGDRVTVDREDGSSVHWRVDAVEEHAKDEFPTEAVYGDTREPTLRLVTCSGFFDPETRSYDANTIVFLTLDEGQDVDPVVADAPELDAGPFRGAELEPAGAARGAELQPARDLAEPTGRSEAPARPRAAGSSGDVGGLASLAGQDERQVPIALGVLSLLGAGGAVIRELAAGR